MDGYKNNRENRARDLLRKRNLSVAICHDYLNQYGGAERVLDVFLDMFPNADCYTLFYDEEEMQGRYKDRITKTSFLDIPPVRRHHRAFIPLFPLASSHLRARKKYDLVLSETAGYAKGFGIKGNHHISYCHTPLRYAWERGYMKTLPHVPYILKLLAPPIAAYFRSWDKKTANKIDCLIANSEYIQAKIKKYYERDAEVIYPPVDETHFYRTQEKNKSLRF